jgi:hypothetical protein
MPDAERTAELVEREEHILGLQLEWIRAVDVKTPIVMAIATAGLGALFALLPKPTEFTSWSLAWLVVGSGCLFLSVYLCGRATFPRTSGPESMIFFGGICKLTAAQYAERCTAREDDTYLADLMSQCYRNAEIARDKYKETRRAMIWLYAGIVPWLIAVYFLYKG